MRMRCVAIATLLLGGLLGGGHVFAREPESYVSKVEAQDLFLKEFAGDPSKEVRSQLYTFPPGAVLPPEHMTVGRIEAARRLVNRMLRRSVEFADHLSLCDERSRLAFR